MGTGQGRDSADEVDVCGVDANWDTGLESD
jgi:hypothetical protein